METHRIREIKEEIRVLGIVAFRPRKKQHYEAVGVLFRGRHWLDGVLSTQTLSSEMTMCVAETIRDSKHHPQIRLIMLHEELLLDGTAIDPLRLSTETGRPVIALAMDETKFKKDGAEKPVIYKLTEFSGFSVGLQKEKAEKTIRTATSEGDIPEALRVAAILQRELR
jgi:endonuclease V-like protein UPF0215 family